MKTVKEYEQSHAKVKSEKIRFFAYTAPGTNSKNRHDDFIMKDFAAAGFNTFLMTGENDFNGGEWESSNSKKTIELAKRHGIKEFCLRDDRFIDLIHLRDKLIGKEDCKFSSESELDEYVESCLLPYINEKEIIGSDLRDEPDYTLANSFAAVFKSIKRVAEKLGRKDFQVYMNLLPFCYNNIIEAKEDGTRLIVSNSSLAKNGDYNGIREAYSVYIDNYLTLTGADRISVDDYPFRKGRFLATYYAGLQVLGEACKKHGAYLAFILQAYDTAFNVYREVNLSEMYQQMNSALAFGAKEIGFYTYMPISGSDNENVAKATFVRNDGTHNPVYEYGKKVMADASDFFQTIAPFRYCGSKAFYKTDRYYLTINEKFENDYDLKIVKDVSVDGDLIMCTEMYHADKDEYMYSFINVADSIYNLPPVTFVAEFNEDVVAVAEYYVGTEEQSGFKSIKNLKDGKYEKTLSSGCAVYLIPLK